MHHMAELFCRQRPYGLHSKYMYYLPFTEKTSLTSVLEEWKKQDITVNRKSQPKHRARSGIWCREEVDCRKWRTLGPNKQNDYNIYSSYYLKWIENRWIKYSSLMSWFLDVLTDVIISKINIWTRWISRDHSGLNIHNCKHFPVSPRGSILLLGRKDSLYHLFSFKPKGKEHWCGLLHFSYLTLFD